MRDTFDSVFAKLMASEGTAYENDPHDPGGPTKFGITHIDLAKWRGHHVTPADVRAMQIEEARDIYRAKYWATLRCDELPAGVDYVVFDMGVNTGVYQAAKDLQRVVGAKVDGVIGGLTLAAVGRMQPEAIIDALGERRAAFYRQLRTFWRFGKGWLRRVTRVQADALNLARAAGPFGRMQA